MIGDEYLQVRAQLGTALFSLSNLAHSLHASREALQTLQDLRAELRDPFLFVVAGEAKSGKTSLINALFGRELLPADASPSPHETHVFKYGPEEAMNKIDGGFTECFLPYSFLRDFNIVDTPGTSAIGGPAQAFEQEFPTEADLMLFVFSVTNPWAASAWNFLNLIETKSLKKIVFVLQQSDLRNDLEVTAVSQHLEQRLQEKFPSQNRVFTVSAKKAFLAKTTGTDKEGLLKQSHFPALESYLNDTVMQSEERLEKLRAICNAAQPHLSDIGEKARNALSLIGKDAEKLDELHSGIEERRGQSMRHAGGIVWTLTQSYDRLQKLGEELLQQQLSFVETFKFRRESWRDKTKPAVDAELKESIHRQIQSSFELLETDLQQTWQQLHDSLRRRFSAEVGASIAPELLDERKELLAHIEFSIMERMSRQSFAQQMRELFASPAQWLGVPETLQRTEGLKPVIAALTELIAADFNHALTGTDAVPGTPNALMKRKRVLAQFRAGMARQREELVTTMENHLHEALGAFYRKLGDTFKPLQSFCTAQRQIFEPRITTVQQMEETFAKVRTYAGPAPDNVKSR